MIHKKRIPQFVNILDQINSILIENAREYATEFEKGDPNAEERNYQGSAITFIGMFVDRVMDRSRNG